MWRFSMHAIGGLGLIVIALSLGLFGASTSGLYSAEGRFEHVLPNIVSTVRLIAGIAVIFIGISTILFTVMCLFSGMDPVRAFLHSLWIAISGFMNAGFTPTSQSLAYYHSYPMELGCIVLMVLGAINFGLFVEVWRGNTKAFFKDLEIRTGLIWILVAGCVFMFSLSANGMFSDLPALLRRGVFMLFAASTTTGFQVVTGNQLTTVLSSGAFLTLALLMAVGGSANSTSGGMKFERLGMVAKSVVSTVRETLAPDSAKISVTYEHIKRRVLRTDVVRAAMTVATLYVFTYIAGALAGIANGYDAVQAIFESVAVASNGGLSAGIISQDMPVGLEMVYILEMWAGRLEFITLLSLVVKIVASCIPSPAFRGVKE
jgi:trk system potassium uptake protein TrkH